MEHAAQVSRAGHRNPGVSRGQLQAVAWYRGWATSSTAPSDDGPSRSHGLGARVASLPLTLSCRYLSLTTLASVSLIPDIGRRKLLSESHSRPGQSCDAVARTVTVRWTHGGAL